MGGVVEDNNNAIFQVFHEFAEFLNCIYYYHFFKNKHKHIENICLDAMRIHARAIIDFFQKNKKESDDLIYTDFIDASEDLSISTSIDLRRFINKSTAHISQKRGNLSFNNDEYFKLIENLVFAIEHFIDECGTSLKDEHKNDYKEDDVKTLKKYIKEKMFPKVWKCIINA